VALASAALLAGCGSDALRSSDSSTSRSAPLMTHYNPPTRDRSLPPSILADVARRQSRAHAAARRFADRPATEAAGCEHFRNVGADRRWIVGPPAPKAHARSIGHFVTVVLRFRAPLPRSPACRPRSLRITAYSGHPGGTLNNLGSPSDFAITGSSGRATVSLPWGGRPPYHVSFRVETVLGRASRKVTLPVVCPPRACLSGLRSTRSLTERSRRPLGGISLSQLRRSFAEAVSLQGLQYVRVTTTCESLRVCLLRLRSPTFPRARWAREYRLNAEHRAGCWSAASRRYLGRKPYDAAPTGPDRLVSCVGWHR
jgi:hypothetical protein